jgi:hypothetical protein
LERWRWLKEHAAIVIQTRGHTEIEGIYDEEDEDLKSIRLQHDRLNIEHVLPRTVPSIWAKPLEELYKNRISDLAETTLSLSYKRISEIESNIRYLAGANKQKSSRDRLGVDDEVLSMIELPSPGSRYDEAYDLVYFASAYRLSKDRSGLDGKSAMAFLKKSGFEILRVDDFMRIFARIENLHS